MGGKRLFIDRATRYIFSDMGCEIYINSLHGDTLYNSKARLVGSLAMGLIDLLDDSVEGYHDTVA